MEQKHFERFYKASEEHIERVRAVGSINLVPDSGRKGYILATIDVLNKQLDNRSVFLDELIDTVREVVKYRLWDWMEDGSEDTTIFRSTAGLHRDIMMALANLETNGLIDRILCVTDLGRDLLNEIVVPVEQVSN